MTYHLDESELTHLYDLGWGISSIAKRFGVSYRVIRLRLARCGVEFRAGHESAASVWRLDPTIRDRVGRRRWPVNEHYFDILTPDSAYIIGLLQADGSVNARRVTITLKSADAALLHVIAVRMGAERPLIPTRSVYGNGVCLYIGSYKIAQALHGWGLHSPKTHTATTHPALLLDRDYWRGVMDGDGTLCVSAEGQRILSLVGSEFICREFLAFCRHHGCGLNVNVRPHKRIFSARLSGVEAARVAGILYDSADLALERKRIVYMRHFVS